MFVIMMNLCMMDESIMRSILKRTTDSAPDWTAAFHKGCCFIIGKYRKRHTSHCLRTWHLLQDTVALLYGCSVGGSEALVVAKELTLKQAIELNKQKAPVEEGLDKIVNLFDDDVDLERFTRSFKSDVVALRGGVQWENGQSALVSPGLKRRPGSEIKVFCCRTDNGDLWQLLRTQCNTQTKVKGTKADDIPIHPLQQGIHGVSTQHFLKLL